MHRHGATHRGHVRPGNEDAFYVGEQVFAVADGVGGAPAGEVASGLAIEQIKRLDGAIPSDGEEARSALIETVRDATRAIRAAAEEHPERQGMATTLTAAAVRDDRLVLAHVGDSRAYLFRDGRLEQLTRDHTAAEEAVQAGQLDRAAVATHPHRHMLVRAVGANPTVPVATTPPQELEPGDRLLLCSDGLTEPCDDALLARVLGQARDTESSVAALIDAALELGGPDNITVVLVDF